MYFIGKCNRSFFHLTFYYMILCKHYMNSKPEISKRSFEFLINLFNKQNIQWYRGNDFITRLFNLLESCFSFKKRFELNALSICFEKNKQTKHELLGLVQQVCIKTFDFVEIMSFCVCHKVWFLLMCKTSCKSVCYGLFRNDGSVLSSEALSMSAKHAIVKTIAGQASLSRIQSRSRGFEKDPRFHDTFFVSGLLYAMH